MKICLVHNAYGKPSGEETAVESLRECLEGHGHEVVIFSAPARKSAVAPADAPDLAEKIRYLWERPELCRAMGEAARKKIAAMFSPETSYARLLQAYGRAIESHPGAAAERFLGVT